MRKQHGGARPKFSKNHQGLTSKYSGYKAEVHKEQENL